MFKKCIVLFLAVCFLTTPAFAAGQKLPTWLAETGATSVTDVVLENTQGEWVPVWLLPYIPAICVAGMAARKAIFSAISTGQFGKVSMLLEKFGLK